MDQKQLQQAFLQYIAQKTGAKTEDELKQVIQQLGEEGLKQAYAQFMQELQQQQAQYAMNGAKLDYIRGLRGKCPDGYETRYYKSGGKVCKKCVAKAAGGQSTGDPIKDFKKNRKVKKGESGTSTPRKNDFNGAPTNQALMAQDGDRLNNPEPINEFCKGSKIGKSGAKARWRR